MHPLQLNCGLLHRRHSKVVIFMFWHSFLTFRFLVVRSALRVQQQPLSRMSAESEALSQQTPETVFIAWSWDEIRMSVSRLSRLDGIDKQRPGPRSQNWMRGYGCARLTFATDTKTGSFRWCWTRVAPSQLACRWTQENPSDTTYWESHFVQIRRFLTKSSALFARSALQN